MSEKIRLAETSFIEQTARKFSQPLLAKLQPTVRWKVLDFLRGFKNHRIRENIKIRNPKRIIWKEGIEGVVSICHDVDYAMDYNSLEKIVSLENDYGISSTINFLTNWDYKLEDRLLFNLSDDGFEIGLHGYTHDIGLGYRSQKSIRKTIKMALKGIPLKIRGFRAPALSVSERLLSILSEEGIEYDSSILVNSKYSQGIETCSPYRYPGIDIWEVPLAIQDSLLFRDFGLEEDVSFSIVKGLIEEIIDLNGVAIINLHPSIMVRKSIFFQSLLSHLKTKEKIWLTPLSNLIDYLNGFNPPGKNGE